MEFIINRFLTFIYYKDTIMKNTIFALNTVHKQIAAMLIATVLMFAIGAPLWMVNRADAAQLVLVSDTLSDSDKGVVSNHTISFTTSDTGQLATGENFTITFASGFVIPDSLDYTDVDLKVDGGDQSIAATSSSGVWGVDVATTTRIITIDSDNTSIGTGTIVEIQIGTNATFTETGDQQITNPNPGSSTSYPITIGGTMDDSGITRVVIIDDVTMTASVDTTLTFNIYGTASSTDINGVDTFATSTATSMAFGTLESGTPKVLGQRLTVETNALNGFSVTIIQDTNLISASGADIDLFVHGDATSTPQIWSAPDPDVADENTWGHYGITSEDNSLSWGAGNDPFVSALFTGNFATSSTPLEIFYHDGPTNGSTAHEGETEVAIKIEINALQEAANDYSNSLTYVCTPVF